MITEETFTAVSLFKYRLPFKSPLQLSETRLEQRRVLLLQCITNKEEYWLECSPLPAYSQNTLEDCIEQLKSVFAQLTGASLSLLKKTITNDKHLLPSISFPLNDLFERSLDKTAVCPVNICPLILDDEILLDSPVLKLKVGQNSIEEDIDRIQTILSSKAFTGCLRLDANQQWLKSDIEQLSKTVDCSRIEWLEDPLLNTADYKEWQSFSAIALALDESLYQAHISFLEKLNPKALILKPAMLGWQGLQHYIELANNNCWRTIISSSFEGPIGMAALTRFAQKLSPDEFHGLDTLKYFPDEYQHKLVHKNLDLVERWRW
ncbi:O-succinylbenzoate synthase [Alteromonadaceae bacterium Bs31]|nr:O-succinylbenzoate synthase [Alteromonadaceae bacterium Bs31]